MDNLSEVELSALSGDCGSVLKIIQAVRSYRSLISWMNELRCTQGYLYGMLDATQCNAVHGKAKGIENTLNGTEWIGK